MNMSFEAIHSVASGSVWPKASHHAIARLLLAVIPVILSACDPSEPAAYQPEFTSAPISSAQEYIFGVHPQRNPEKLHAVFGPLINYLNTQLPDARFVFEASRNFASFDQKQANHQFAFVLPNPYGTVVGIENGYKVFAQMGNENDLRGMIVIRRDSPIRKVTDLKGKVVSFPAPTALAATMMTKYFLHTHGLNVNTDIESRYVGSMESSLMNVYQRNVAAGTVYPPAWRDFQKNQPQVAAELKVMWETESLPDNSLMARADIPQELVDRVAQLILNMHTTDEGKAILAGMDMAKFKPANNATYQPVKDFLKKYTASIPPDDATARK